LLPENNFNIARALVGSESTCITIVEATMKLVTNPKARTLLVLGYQSLPEAGYAVPDVLKHKPIGLEAIDDLLIDFNRRKGMNLKDLTLLPFAGAWLMVEFGGDSKEDADNKAKQLMEDLKQKKNPPVMSLFDDPEQEHKLWVVRESSLGATAWVPGEPNGGPGGKILQWSLIKLAIMQKTFAHYLISTIIILQYTDTSGKVVCIAVLVLIFFLKKELKSINNLPLKLHILL
jgi:hypothetical protein